MKHFRSYLSFLLLSFFLLQSCEKDELPQIESETLNFPKLKGRIISVEDLLNKPELENKILSLSKDSFRKSNGSNQIQIDTTHIEVIESDQFTAYTFAIVQDSIEKQSILRNYMLTIINDSLQVQSLVSYPVLANKQLDMQNIQFEQVWGDSLITQTRFKCGGTQTTWYSYEDCYNYNCHGNTGDGTHGIGDNSCKASAGDRAGTNCVTRWASFTYQEGPCETIGAGPSSGGGGGGSGGGGNTNPPINNPPIDLVIPISPVGELQPIDDIISTINNQLTLTPQQRTFLTQPANEHITDAVDEYLDEQVLTMNEEGKQALRDVIDVLSGEKGLDDLLTILANRMYNEILGKTLSNLPSGQFDDLGAAMQNLDPNDNLNLTDWQNISQRNAENYSIISGVIGNNVWSSLSGSELIFSQLQQETITANALFSNMLSEIKEIVQNNVPQTPEEWEALLQIMEPLLWESLIEFIPGGGIAIAINDIVTEMSATPADYTVITLAVVSIVAEFIPWAKVGKATAKTFKNLAKAFKIFKKAQNYLLTVRRAYKKGLKIRIDGDDVFIHGSVNNSSGPVLQLDRDIAKISNNILTFKYRGYGGDVVTNPNKTTTVIGKRIDPTIGGTDDFISTGVSKTGDNVGGINALDFDDSGLTPQQIWNNHNKLWLESAMQRGDNIRAVSNPLSATNVFYNNPTNQVFNNLSDLENYMTGFQVGSPQWNNLGYYGKEIHLLYRNGYRFNPLTVQFEL